MLALKIVGNGELAALNGDTDVFKLATERYGLIELHGNWYLVLSLMDSAFCIIAIIHHVLIQPIYGLAHNPITSVTWMLKGEEAPLQENLMAAPDLLTSRF